MNASLSIRCDHPAYKGHFPGDPILPGVVLLDEALHAIGIILEKDLSACVINNVKFLSPVRPGEPVTVDFTLTEDLLVRFQLHSHHRKVATGVLRLAHELLASDAGD